jgi:hypothetical protein
VLSEFAVRRFILSSEIHFRKTKNGIELGPERRACWRVAVNRKTARIGNSAIVAEGAEWSAVEIEGEKRTVAVTIGTGRAGDEKRHRNRAPNIAD